VFDLPETLVKGLEFFAGKDGFSLSHGKYHW